VMVRKNLKLSVIVRLSGPRVLAATAWAMLLVMLHEVVGLTWLGVPNTAVGPLGARELPRVSQQRLVAPSDPFVPRPRGVQRF
jgi:hypothetical protein